MTFMHGCFLLKSVHFKNTVARSSVHSKLLSFSIIHQLTSKQSKLMLYCKVPQFWKKWGSCNCVLKWTDFTCLHNISVRNEISTISFLYILALLKTGSSKIIYWLFRFSCLMGFIMSKNPKGLWFHLLIKSSVRNLSRCFDIIKPRRKENLQRWKIILPDPVFNLNFIYFTYFHLINFANLFIFS